jgi:hypothetical protein
MKSEFKSQGKHQCGGSLTRLEQASNRLPFGLASSGPFNSKIGSVARRTISPLVRRELDLSTAVQIETHSCLGDVRALHTSDNRATYYFGG